MTTTELLFSFKGSITRKEYWTRGFLLLLPPIIVATLLGSAGTVATFVLMLVLALPICWMSAALAAKRLRDRGRSAWFLLPIIIPGLGFVWAIWVFKEVWFGPSI